MRHKNKITNDKMLSENIMKIELGVLTNKIYGYKMSTYYREIKCL